MRLLYNFATEGAFTRTAEAVTSMKTGAKYQVQEQESVGTVAGTATGISCSRSREQKTGTPNRKQ